MACGLQHTYSMSMTMSRGMASAAHVLAPAPVALKLEQAIPIRSRVYTVVCDLRASFKVIRILETLGETLAPLKFKLRSGATCAGEVAAERGARRAQGSVEIYLPWAGYNRHTSPLYQIPEDAFRISADLEPNWLHLGRNQRKFMARCTVELFGKKLSKPSLFVLCWTPSGSGEGELRHLIQLATTRGIPILDIGSFDSLPQAEALRATLDWLAQFGVEQVSTSSHQMRLAV